MKTNFHTHTYRCKHATGDIDDYVKHAIDSDLDVLGIADHTPLPEDQWPEDRMTLLELEDYTQKIEKAQKENNNKITIFKGMECDPHPSHIDFFKKELLEKRGYDYLISSVHYIEWKNERQHAAMLTEEDQIAIYKDNLIFGIEQGIFAFVGHPDFFAVTFHKMTTRVEQYCREIFQAASEYNIPLEINGGGFTRKTLNYPWPAFWELGKEYDIQVICNSDAHHPEHVANIAESINLAQRFGHKICYNLKTH